MTVIAVVKDPTTWTMRITAEYDAPREQVWRLWSDPRLLERWWGPPSYPATFDSYDLTPGALLAYHMTGPGGDQPRGWWKVLVVEAPHRLELEGGVADDDGNPSPEMPTMHLRVDITEAVTGTRMVITATLPSPDAWQQMLAMGTDEGMTQAVGQIDDILVELAKAT